MTNPNSQASGKRPPPPPPEKLPPIVALLLSGIANLKYAITGKTEDSDR